MNKTVRRINIHDQVIELHTDLFDFQSKNIYVIECWLLLIDKILMNLIN